MRLTRLDVASLPGIPLGFTLEPGPGVNVVVGPNTSGKTSLVRAVHSLLWPDAVSGASHMRLAAAFSADGLALSARRGSDGAVTWERDGAPVAAPALPTGQMRDRYDLGLLDLVTRDRGSATFAAAVRRQMTGGFDLDLTGAMLFPRNGGQTSRKRGNCLRADNDVERIGREFDDLRRREAGRARLLGELAAARAAGARAPAVRAARDAQAARLELARAAAELARLPAGLASFLEDDPEALEAARGQVRQAQAEVTTGRERVEAAKAELARLPAAPEGAPDPAGIEPLLDAWDAAARARDNAGSERDGARARAAVTRERLGGAVAAAAAVPDREAVTRLARLFVASEAARSRRQVAGLLLLDPALAGGGGDIDEARLEAAQAAVDDWLETSASSAAWPALTVLAGIAAVVLSALPPRNLPVLVAATVASVGGAMALAHAVSGTMRQARRAQRARQALADAGISEATPDRRAAVAALSRRRQAAARAAAAAVWRARLEAEQQAADRQERETGAEAAALREACGLGRDLTAAGVLHDTSLLAALFEADADLARCEAEVQARQAKVDEAAARARGALARADLPVDDLGDVASAVAALKAWRERLAARARVQATARREEESVAEAEQRLAGAREDLLRRRRRLALAPDGSQDDLVRDLAVRHDAWLRTVAARDSAEAALALAMRTAGPELPELAPADLDALLAEALAADERREQLQQAIMKLDLELQQAREDRRYEDALAASERARDDLAEDRTLARRAALADAMLADLRAQTASARPAVLEKAIGHLHAFTRGDHRLDLVAGRTGTEPAFVAVDTRTRERQSLEQLSDGTRAQLLLAVRLAFVETLEDGKPLPLFLDEALTTTDDERFAAIAGALGELARGDDTRPGRQVFYLTSQPHDAGAWERALARRGLAAPRVLDLAAARGLAAAAGPAQLPPPGPAPVPRPEPGRTGLAAYRLLLRVPPFEPYRGSDGQHVDWLLLDDAELLYRLESERTTLVGRVLATLGSLVAWKVLDDATAGAIVQRARLLEAFCACWRIGRGRPVTEQDIDKARIGEAKIVSSTMRERIIDLLKRVDGDPRRFAAGLDKVSRLQRSVAADLRDYLRDIGVIPDRDPLDETTLLERVLTDLGFHAGPDGGPQLTRELVQDCVSRWWRAAEAATPPPPGDG